MNIEDTMDFLIGIRRLAADGILAIEGVGPRLVDDTERGALLEARGCFERIQELSDDYAATIPTTVRTNEAQAAIDLALRNAR